MPPTNARLKGVFLRGVVLAGLACVVPAAGSHCSSSDVSSTAGLPRTALNSRKTSFTCDDNVFLKAVDVGSSSYLQSLKWKCSDGTESQLLGSTASYLELSTPSFDVAITAVKARTYSDGANYPVLSFMGQLHVGGNNLDWTTSTSSFSWSGPYGHDGEYSDDYTSSICPDGSYATGVDVWESDNFIYGISLKCAAATDTCQPGGSHITMVSSMTKVTAGKVAIGSAFILPGVIGVAIMLRRRRNQEQAQKAEAAKHPPVDESVSVP